MTPRRKIIPVFIPHLGCPYSCVFCDQRGISGASTPPSADEVRAIPRDADAELAFYGGSFTAIPKKLQNAYLDAAAPNAIRVSTRPDCVDSETVARLTSRGVRTIELGAQSMCPDVLELSGRGHGPEDTIRAARAVQEGGASLILQMMTGLPGDTREKSIYTAQKLAELRPDGVRVYPTVVVRNTELCELWRRGEYREHTVDEAVELCAELVGIFDAAKIPIIRLGLNPSDGLSAGDAVAGAYHPAFGELVYSRVWLDAAREQLRDAKPGEAVTLTVPRGKMSVAVGQKRRNIELLTREFMLKSLRIVESVEI
ncbi:MAG: radical SAM protein [Oscillospiraceae bacterium]|jgi:histone acetyltransferase (RNA polymerase elongator complex component)|nr:radical SAM protein [Oscillospiraceae bacterium]